MYTVNKKEREKIKEIVCVWVTGDEQEEERDKEDKEKRRRSERE